MRTIQETTYYTSQERMLDLYDREAAKSRFTGSSPEEFEAWKNTFRKQLTEITGIDRTESCDLTPKQLESVQMDGYKRDKLLIQTEPDVWMPFYVLIPDGAEETGKNPCMIAPHGHGGGGKYAVAGRRDIPSVKEKIEAIHYDYGVDFVRQGYITFCPDARGFGERREWMGQQDQEASFMNSTCIPLNHMAICMGRSLTGLWTWDLMRLIDYIVTREDCDPERIGCGGLSGGGLQTLWVTAMDDRIKCAVVSGYFYGYKDSLLRLSVNCGCNYVPHLWEYADMGDLGALIAPRPLLIETGSLDPLNGERGVPNVTEQVEIAQKSYRLFNMDERITHFVFEGMHEWNGEKTPAFLKKWL
jgi:dienelactone hydrolase